MNAENERSRPMASRAAHGDHESQGQHTSVPMAETMRKARELDAVMFPVDAPPDGSREQLRIHIADYVFEFPGRTLLEIADEFHVTVDTVRAALRHPAALTGDGFYPIALRGKGDRYRLHEWRYPSSADEVGEYLRDACLDSTLGDIYSMESLASKARGRWGDGCLNHFEDSDGGGVASMIEALKRLVLEMRGRS